MLKNINSWKTNMHKPTLTQHAAFIIQNMNGDAEWLRDDFYTLQAFVDKYLNFQRNKATGLMYWETDQAIGVDNDPSTFYRPNESSGSIFLNVLMYKELRAMVYISGCLHLNDIAKIYNRDDENLLKSIQEYCWDPRDGFYYSVDLNLRPVEKPDIKSLQPGQLIYHVGQPRTYDCLI